MHNGHLHRIKPSGGGRWDLVLFYTSPVSRQEQKEMQLIESASGKWHMCVLEMSVAWHPTHPTGEIKPCENQLKGHLLQATETLSTASSEGTTTTHLKGSRWWFTANQVVPGCPRAQQSSKEHKLLVQQTQSPERSCQGQGDPRRSAQ